MAENKKTQLDLSPKGIDKGFINAWVAENIKTIEDVFNFQKSFQKRFTTTTSEIPTRREVSILPSSLQKLTGERIKNIGKDIRDIVSRSITVASSQIPTVVKEAEAATSGGFSPYTKEAKQRLDKEFLEAKQERQIHTIFNNLANMGFFRDSSKAFPIWKDLIAYAVTNPKGQIPYWSNLALWQVGVVDRSINLYQYAKEVAKKYAEAGTPVTVDNVINMIYADNFSRVWEMMRSRGLPVQLPDADTSYLFNPYSENSKIIGDITKDWITRVYAGYKLLKTEPPNPIKILYHTLSKETSATSRLEEGIYGIGQDIQGATGETTEVPIEETTSEPEVYTIQNQFLRK